MEEIPNESYRKKIENNSYTRRTKELLAQASQIEIYRVTRRTFDRHENRATGAELRREFESIVSRNDFDRGDQASAFIFQDSAPYDTGQNSRRGGIPGRNEFFETRRFLRSYRILEVGYGLMCTK